MRYFIVIFLLNIYVAVFAQELSLQLQITEDTLRYDTGLQIAEVADGFLILGQCQCVGSPNTCPGLLKIDQAGNTLWKKVYEGDGDPLLQGTARTMLVHDDRIYLATLVWKTGHQEIRLLSFDGAGNIENTKDIAIPNESLFLDGMIESNNQLFLFGQVKLGGYGVFIHAFDLSFNEVLEKDIGHSNLIKRGIDFSRNEGDGFLLAYGEQLAGSQVKMVLHKLDAQLNSFFTKEIPESDLGDPFRAVNILSADDGYLLAWNKDLSYSLFDTFPFPTTVYQLDTDFAIVGESIFVHKAYKEHISFSKTSKGHLLGVGATDYFTIHDIYPERILDGWCFLMDANGSLLWERTIADNEKSPPSGAFRHGIETDNGFALIGTIGISPMIENQDVWFVSLDENGCWNGNCNEYLVLADSTTAIQNPSFQNSSLTIFPNPTANSLTIICDDATAGKNRTAQIRDLNGNLITAFEIKASKSTIHLSHLNSGIYVISYIVDGQAISTQELSVHH